MRCDIIWASIVFLALLSGCSYGSMYETTYDKSTGKESTTIYSKEYSVGLWLVEGKMGVQIVVDHEKKNVPGLYGAKEALGALWPDDLSAMGLYTIYIWNHCCPAISRMVAMG